MNRRGHGEGTIYQRVKSDGRWVARLELGWSGGRRVRKHLYGDTRREVVEQLEAARQDLHRGIVLTGRRQTVGDFLERWLEDVVKPSVAAKTFKSYSQLTHQHLIPSLGKIPLERLSPQNVQACLNAKSRAGLSPRTVQYLRAVLRAALNQALRWSLVGRNVAELVDPPRQVRYRPRFLDVDEARAFLTAVAGDGLEALYILQITLGLRPGEALGLTWEDVDLSKGQLKVHRQLERDDVKTDTAAGRRTLNIPAFTLEALREHRQRQQAQPVATITKLVFQTGRGTPYSERNVVRHFKMKLAAAGLPKAIRFYDLRHSCASFLVAAGVHPRQIMEVLGHSSIRVTMDTYSHIMAQDRGAANAMDQVLGG
jgi:integrase